jgi:hypothetical protein
MEAGMASSESTTRTAFKINEYRASAVKCEQRAKKTRNQVDREWQMILARAYLMLAEAEAERSALHGRENSVRAAAQAEPASAARPACVN